MAGEETFVSREHLSTRAFTALCSAPAPVFHDELVKVKVRLFFIPTLSADLPRVLDPIYELDTRSNITIQMMMSHFILISPCMSIIIYILIYLSILRLGFPHWRFPASDPRSAISAAA